MLSSRYLHLHEALGLGPMWLKRGAKFVPATPAAPEAAAPEPATPVRTAEERHDRTLSAGAHHARMAAMAAVHGDKKQSAPTHTPPQTDRAEPVRTADTASSARQVHDSPPTQNLPAADVRLSDDLPRLSAAVKPARLMVVSICPSTEDTLHGELFHGEVGILLDNMLAAIRLAPQQVHKTSWVKAAPVFSPTPSETQIREEMPALRQELEASQAQAVLFLGQIFEQKELIAAMDELCGGIPHFTCPHPARLLRQPRLKAYAWQVLKKAAAALVL